MKKIFDFLVNKRIVFLILFIVLTGLSIWAIPQVEITNEITDYLPKDSIIIDGLSFMEDEFGEESTLRVVYEGLSNDDITAIYNDLSEIEFVRSVLYDSSETYQLENHTLFILNIPYQSNSEQAQSVLKTIEEEFSSGIAGGDIFFTNQPIIPVYLIVIAAVVLVIILFVFTSSWIEPFLFMVTFGIAIVINLGSNVILSSVTSTTFSIASLLQICLSIDYSIMLLNRYRQEKQIESNNVQAMKNALSNAFQSIAGSSLTTIIGLLCLLFMSFAIGTDMGLVIGKGVFVSLLTVFLVLPGLILIFDQVIEKTQKKSFHIKTDWFASLTYKARVIIPILFVLIFVGSFYLRNNAKIGYVLPENAADKSYEVFEKENTTIILYNNSDEANINQILLDLNANSHVLDINAYSTTVGVALNATELSALSGISQMQTNMILGASGVETMTLYDFLDYIITNMSSLIPADQLVNLTEAKAQLQYGYESFVGQTFSRMIITTDYTIESEEDLDFISHLQVLLNDQLDEPFYMLGNSAIAYEMASDFNHEYIIITIITIVAIFFIVALTFKSISIPLLLVVIIQNSIFITTGVLGLLGNNVYFLALLVVQAILMGATIDYAILFTSNYKEERKKAAIKASLKSAYKNSIHTIITSSSILVIITGLLGIISNDPTISQVLKAIAVGTASSTISVLFILPPVLILLDKLVIRYKRITS